MTGGAARDHGGDLDAAVARFGGRREDWLDLSTGINPVPYPPGDVSPAAWTGLPDAAATGRLLDAARAFWNAPPGAGIVAAPGASALIARMPGLSEHGRIHVPGPTYNEHEAAFRGAGRRVSPDDPGAPVHVYVHPNNPDGRTWPAEAIGGRPLTVVDESFRDAAPGDSHAGLADRAGVVVLKSLGKFWGLAGLRLGFAIGDPALVEALREALGPWPVSGPALEIGARALADVPWADETRARLARDAARLDGLMAGAGAASVGGTALFRLYEVDDALGWRDRLAGRRVWSRAFPYSGTWLRLGLPPEDGWARLEEALR